ncbi:VOC family protein [Streptomyces sp. 15-116A]|uniref:VOC family protein n=1 Tax=Streptomyces sp. 15-116A TaxID=2259035 RepID=UPI0021B28800|nr:VOC family protein [Streptomyces sp. 15-116A]MCT7353498.1 VOC family protein [Streptomyces sp. 15-116A]
MTIRWTYAYIDRPAAHRARTTRFWTAVTETRLSASRGDEGEFATLVPDGADPCVKLQAVGSGGGGAHLDLCAEDVPEFAATALRLGARTVAEYDGWSVLSSPAGQLFCAVPWEGEAVRPGIVHGSRLDQVCLDTPPSLWGAEVAFWSALLPHWKSRPGSRPEFHVLAPPAGLPVRVLLQRLDDERPPSAHPDLACADIAGTRARHEEFGATFVAAFAHWTVMRDPAGGLYCLTGRDPETGGLSDRS